MKVMTIALVSALAGCINIGEKNLVCIRERRVDITATGFESLPVGRHKFFVNSGRTPPSYYYGYLTVTEDRHYIYFAAENEEAK